jgi:hypothetical protein
MGAGNRNTDGMHLQPVRADTLNQVEPDHAGEFNVRPISLTRPERGDQPVTVPTEPRPVRAWVRYPAIAAQVHGRALAWTPRAVYVEWEDDGTHRAWVWASAVEHAARSHGPASTDNASPRRTPAAPAFTRIGTPPLVDLVNLQLAQFGAEFVLSMSQPAGPFSTIALGSIEGHHLRLDFLIEPATDMCAVRLFDLRKNDSPAPQVAAPTFEEAIEKYAWAEALEALTLEAP